MTSKPDLILHPVRMRLILALAHRQPLSAQQLAEALPDVPQATLYRHLNRLYRAGIFAVVAERQVRGAVEKVYAFSPESVNVTQTDLASASRDDHMRYFATFLASLMDEFARYLQQETINYEADGVGYRQVPLYLSDEEFKQMSGAFNAALLPLLANRPAPGRRRRILTSIVMPASDAAEAGGESGAREERS